MLCCLFESAKVVDITARSAARNGFLDYFTASKKWGRSFFFVRDSFLLRMDRGVCEFLLRSNIFFFFNEKRIVGWHPQ